MDLELKLIKFFTRKLPRIRGSGFLANKLIKFYNRKKRPAVISTYKGIKMLLEPHECVDSALIFYPQLYDYKEIEFMEKNLKQGDTFIDIGANVGFYSLIASKVVGMDGKVLAIEPEKYNLEKLKKNIDLNKASNILIVPKCVSDKKESLLMLVNITGNRGGSRVVKDTDISSKANVERVECEPLLSILETYGLKKIDGLKIDIEGMEYKVLRKFLETAPENLLPRFIICEVNPGFEESKFIPQLMKQYKYELIEKTKLNHIYMKKV